MEMTTAEPADRLAYSENDLDQRGVLSRKTRWRLRRIGAFPEPVRAGGRTLYRATDVHEWLADPEGWAERHGDPGVEGATETDS